MKKVSKIIFWLIWVVFPLGQLVRIQLSNYLPGLKLQPLDFLVYCFVLAWVVAKIKDRKFKPTFLFKEMLVFAGIAFFSLLLNFSGLSFAEFLPAFLYWFRLMNFILFYPALVDFLRQEKISIFRILFFEGLAVGTLAVLQYLFLPDLRFLYLLGWDDHLYRAAGTFLDPSFTAMILLLSLLALFVHNLKKKKDIRFWSICFYFLGTIGLTFSRTVYAATLIGLGLVLILSRKFKELGLICLSFLLIVLFLPKPAGEGVDLLRTKSFFARVENYGFTWKIIKNNYLFGVGYNTLRSVQRDIGFLSPSDWMLNNAGAGSDNSFLFVWATCGIFGLTVFIFLLVKLLKLTVNSLNKESSLLLFTSLIILIFSSFMVNFLFYPWILAWLMLLVANFTVDNAG